MAEGSHEQYVKSASIRKTVNTLITMERITQRTPHMLKRVPAHSPATITPPRRVFPRPPATALGATGNKSQLVDPEKGP